MEHQSEREMVAGDQRAALDRMLPQHDKVYSGLPLPVWRVQIFFVGVGSV